MVLTSMSVVLSRDCHVSVPSEDQRPADMSLVLVQDRVTRHDVDGGLQGAIVALSWPLGFV